MFIQFARFSPPRNPVLRVLLGALGLVLLAIFSVVGLFIAAAVALLFFARVLWRQWRFPSGFPQTEETSQAKRTGESSRVSDGDVIDGEFTVIDQHRRSNH
ncbi:MAG: hypothetical protein KDI75_08090 [Xanthomonadales bacterium]|nr:hypothetical protein [Xanthomonadales bacterium]